MGNLNFNSFHSFVINSGPQLSRKWLQSVLAGQESKDIGLFVGGEIFHHLSSGLHFKLINGLGYILWWLNANTVLIISVVGARIGTGVLGRKWRASEYLWEETWWCWLCQLSASTDQQPWRWYCLLHCEYKEKSVVFLFFLGIKETLHPIFIDLDPRPENEKGKSF